MKRAQNIRFLLALGGQKVVVTQERQHTHIYANPVSTRQNVSLKRLSALVIK